jgi:hypothetical protein
LNFRIRTEKLLAENGAGRIYIGCGLRGCKANHAARCECQQHKRHENPAQKLRISLN